MGRMKEAGQIPAPAAAQTIKPLRVLSAAEEAQIDKRRELHKQYLPEFLPFLKRCTSSD